MPGGAGAPGEAGRMNTAPIIRELRRFADMIESGKYRLMNTEIKADHTGKRYTGEVSLIVDVFDADKCEPDPYLS